MTMTQQDTLGLNERKLRILTLHGLPEREDVTYGSFKEPQGQLEPIRQKLGIQEGDPSWRDYLWAFRDKSDLTTREKLNNEILMQFIRYGNFGPTQVPELRAWLTKQFADISDEHDVVIVAYSAGATIIYAWLADPETEFGDVTKFAKIFCIAGLYEFISPSPELQPRRIILQQVKKPITVREPRIEPELICKKVAPEQLFVMLGENDVTASPLYNNFDLPQCSHIDYSVIDSVDHITILTDRRAEGAAGKIKEAIKKL